jgi:uncharacterized RDD family membrane protein YckC
MRFCPHCGYNLLIHQDALKKQAMLTKTMEELDRTIAQEKTANQFKKFLRSPVLCYSHFYAENIKFASLFRRMCAYFVDSMLLFLIAFLLLYSFIKPPAFPWQTNIMQLTPTELMNYHLNWDIYLTLLLILKFFLALGYFFILESRNLGQTIGKMIMGIRLYNINHEALPSRQEVFIHALGKAFEMGLLIEIIIPRITPSVPLLNQENSPIIKNMIRMSQRLTNIVVIQKE